MKRLIAILFAVALPLTAQQIQVNKDNKTIAITTSDEASALADTAAVTVGFHLYGKDQNATYADATRISNNIIDALKQAGFSKDAIESTNQRLSTLSPHSDEEQARYAQGFRFEFAQSWRVTVKADQAADVLHLAVTNGANDSGDIAWSLREEDALEADAAKKALEHARKIAERMAQGLGVKLGSLVYASNQTPPRGVFLGTSAETVEVRDQKINLKPLAISPERITKSATVYAVFAIE